LGRPSGVREMNMRQILERFLYSSTPDQLRAELTKGNRPLFQTIEDGVFIPTSELSFPGSVTFVQGEFADQEMRCGDLDPKEPSELEANQELALAA